MVVQTRIRWSERLRYNQTRGQLDVYGWQGEVPEATLADAQEVAQFVAVRADFDSRTRALASCYGLVLAARMWAERPSDSRRAALIQAAESTITAHNVPLLRDIVGDALDVADAATMRGENTEAALLAWLADAVRRADRVAERCGRIAAGLFALNDRVLLCGPASAALAWALHAVDAELRPTLLLRGDNKAFGEVARAWGFAYEHIDITTAALGDHQLALASVDRVALDGSVETAPETALLAATLQAQRVPLYALDHDGPRAGLAAADTSVASTLPPAQISAIITHRGMYRPAMIERHLSDGDAPLDVIPLS